MTIHRSRLSRNQPSSLGSRLHPLIGLLVLTAASLGGCGGSPQATSFLGEKLYAPPLEQDVRREREAELAEALASWRATPESEAAIIWLGRRYAYLGAYDKAIDTFTDGLDVHPESYRLLRHRGHRFITTRRLDDAVADLERAASLAAGVPDTVEPDGLPNARNLPRSTTHTNIFYHLALARYLQGRYAQAANAWQRCVELSSNDDMDVAARYWLFIARTRQGDADKARAALDPISEDMDVIENGTYHRLLLLFKGALATNEVFKPDGDEAIQSATAAYGIAIWHELQGDDEARDAVIDAILAGKAWSAFGFIAAEADRARERAVAD
jgi:tetratricopeptide (TPR) repeat protein